MLGTSAVATVALTQFPIGEAEAEGGIPVPGDVDFDQGGIGFHKVRAWLGPSLGWVEVQVQPQANIEAGGTYDVAAGASVVMVDVDDFVTINLPNVVEWMKETAYMPATAFGRALIIKDASGNAGTFPITVVPFDSQTVDGVNASRQITVDTDLIHLLPLNDLSGWLIISQPAASIPVGVKLISDATYTLLSGDNKKILRFTNGSGTTLTVPTGLPSKFSVEIMQSSVGQVDVLSDGTTTIYSLNNASLTSGLYAVAKLDWIASDNYVLWGDITQDQRLPNWVGYVPSQFSFINTQNFSHTAVSAQPPAGWGKANIATVTTNRTSPDGDDTACKIVESSGGAALHTLITPDPTTGMQLGQGFGELDDIPMRVAVIAKAVERTRLVLMVDNGSGVFASDKFVSAGFDLVGGQTSYDNSASGWTILSTTCTQAFEGDWWLCVIDFNVGATSWVSARVGIRLDNGSGTAARSVSYAGDGTSGIDVWWASLLPVAAWTDFTHEDFREDFNSLAVIDVNDTLAPGFSFYVHNHWPITFQFNSCWFLSDKLHPEWLTLANSVVTVARDPGTCSFGLWSAAPNDDLNPTNPDNVIKGYTFQLPFIVEAKRACDPSYLIQRSGATSYGGSNAAFWLISTSIGGPGLDDLALTAEIDIIDATTGTLGNFSTYFTQFNVIADNVFYIAGGPSGPASTTLTDFRQNACMGLAARSSTNDHGILMTFWKNPNNTLAVNSMLVPGGICKQFISTSNLQTQSFYIILGAGYGPFDNGSFTENVATPTAWDWVRVIK